MPASDFCLECAGGHVDVEAIDGGGTKLAGFADRNFPTAHAKKQLAMC